LGHPLVFVTRYAPHDLDRGSPIRAYRLAAGLSEIFTTTVVTFANNADPAQPEVTIDDMRRALPNADVRLVPRRPHSENVHRHLLGRASTQFGRVDTSALRATVAELANGSLGTVVHFDDLAMALGGIGVSAALRVANTHNVEHEYLHRLATTQPLHTRAVLELESRKIAAEERRVWRGFDLTLATSEVDAALIRGSGARRVVVCPNGTDPVERLPMPPLERGRSLRLVFVGSADFWPYALGLAWFVREVMPLVQRDGPVTLEVVGRPPAEPVLHPLVSYTGRVPDVRPHYAAAHALVIPLFQASGTRLKALEAAALGRPVVSTATGMEGLPMQPDTHYFAAETAGDFRRAIGSLRDRLGGSTGVEPMLAAARAQAEPLFWPAITRRLADVYLAELESRQARRPRGVVQQED